MAVLTLGAPCTRFTADGAAPERVIYEFAKLAEVPIGEGLEDAEAQLGRLSTLSREQWDSYVNAHLAWLKDGRCNERFLGNIHRMWANLLEGDADAMYEEYMRFYTEVVPARWFQHDYFVTVRNGPMVEKMVRLVTPESPVFFSVGAIHLAGPEGIVALLQQRGYQVEQK